MTKIHYPTGGTTEYESNTISGILIKDDPRRFLYRNRLEDEIIIFSNQSNPTATEHTFDFTIESNIVGNVFFKEVLGDGCDGNEGNGCFKIKLFDSNHQEISSWKSGDLNLEPGDYYFHATTIPDINGNVKSFEVTVKWEKDLMPNTIRIGGLRVKEIIKNDGNGTVMKKTYDYGRDLTQAEKNSFPGGVAPNNISSGIIGWWPQMVYNNYAYEVDPFCTFIAVLMTSYPQKSMFDYSGSSSLYTKVTERTHNTDSSGSYKTEYYFDGEDVNYPILDYSEPLNYSFFFIADSGNLLKKIEYNTQGKKVKEEIHTYQKNKDDTEHGYGVQIIPNKTSQPVYREYVQKKYYLRPKTQITTEVFDSGEIASEKEYFYENINYQLPSHTETVYYQNGSSKKKTETHYNYPFDFPSDPKMVTLTSQNRITQPVKVQQKRDGVILKTSKALYDSNSQTGNKLLPLMIQVGKGDDGTLENRISYDRYDAFGNPIQVSHAASGSTKISYIYGFKGVHPLAKLENVAYTSIPTHLISAIQSASQSGNETQLKNAQTALRDHYKDLNVMVSTYTYHPIFGMTSATDPSGNSGYHEYDSFGRLKNKKNHNGQRVQSYHYVYGGSSSINYVRTSTHRNVLGVSPIVNTSYLDGLGRPIQEIAHAQSGEGNDLVTPIVYDGYGRTAKEYLPYDRGTTSMTMAMDAVTQAEVFYNTSYFENTTNPYTERKFEDSPRALVLKEAAPGTAWESGSGREIEFEYGTNRNNEVRFFEVSNPTSNPQLKLNTQNQGYYAAHQLYKTITKDENHQGSSKFGTIEEFKDKLGQVVLKRHWNRRGGSGNFAEAYDTYYVYDVYGNLTFVLPPELSHQIISGNSLVSDHIALTDKLGYRYRYDRRNRMIHKKLPGKQTEFIAYDPLDRMVATSPAKSPFLGEDSDGTLHTRYDAFDRVVHTFWSGSRILNESQRESFENGIGNTISETPRSVPKTANGLELYYTTNVLPVPGPVYLTTHIYDRYPTWIGTIPSSISGQEVHYDYTHIPKGMEVATYFKTLGTSSNPFMSRTYTLFDSQLRPIRTHSQNYLGGYTRSDMKYDFIGKVLKTETFHKRTASDDELKTEENFTYTDEDRLLENTHKINALPAETLSKNEYDALGQLVVKKVGNTSNNPLQQVDYKYNIRGWLTDINNVHNLALNGQPLDLFAFKINYNTVNDAHPDVEPLYNGNISQTFWRTANDNILRSYGYVYDPLNRLLDAQYKIPGSSVNNSYNEHLTYDRNGNILTLKRNGEEETEFYTFMIDNLDYKYDGNRLINVTDSTDVSLGFNDGNKHMHTGKNDFEYDDYGNMIVDWNKKITNITYNHLNLPKKITFENMGTIEYLYGADGVKLKKTVTEGSTNKTVDYLDGYQYRNNLLSFFPTAEGYVRSVAIGIGGAPNYSFHYVYNYTDHLGNIRLRYTKDPQTGEIEPLEENHYYPFGLKHDGYNPDHQIFEFDPIAGNVAIIEIPQNATDGYNFKFGNKELQDELNLNVYAFGFRDYDPALGRWNVIDPLSEMYHTTSPYAFVQNNPLINREIDGRYFDDKKSAKQADKIERKAEKQANKLDKKADKIDKKGGNSGDLRDRAGELRQSAQDVRDMRSDASTEYKYAKLDGKEGKALGLVGPSTTLTGQNGKGDNVVTMFTEKNMGNQIHETRHGGQNARGEFNVATGAGYGVADEVSAYRAQYSWDGQLQYRDQPSQPVMLQRMMGGQNPTIGIITNINQINGTVVNSMVDPGFVPIYPPPSIPLNIWNNN